MIIKRELKPKINRLDQLKYLNKSLLNNKLKIDIFTNDKTFKSYWIYRIISLLENNLKICNYINEYMNDLFSYNNINEEEFFETIRTILSINNMNSNQFYYMKYQHNSIEDICNVFKLYLQELNKDYNHQDILSLYNLYKHGIITEDNIIDLKLSLNIIDKKDIKKVTTNKLPNIKTTSTAKDSMTIQISPYIETLCSNIIKFIQSRNICQQCKLFQKPKVILDTNLIEPGPVDIIFVGLNPSLEDINQNRPFANKNNNIRVFINNLLNNISDFKYMITNITLCSSTNENEIKNSITNCNGMLTEIIKLFSPYKLIVPFGDKAAKAFNIQDPIKKSNGRLYFDNIIPLINPESSKSNSELLISGFKNIIKALSDKTELIVEPEINIENSEITDNTTLFDIKNINNKLIKIFIDNSTGEKKYIIEDVKFPVYIKRGNYRDCNYISDNVDAKIFLNHEQRNKLLNNLRNLIFNSM